MLKLPNCVSWSSFGSFLDREAKNAIQLLHVSISVARPPSGYHWKSLTSSYEVGDHCALLSRSRCLPDIPAVSLIWLYQRVSPCRAWLHRICETQNQYDMKPVLLAD
jgi:hypothetical protein